MRQGIAYSWEFLGAALANESDGEQTKFFKSFIKEMDSWNCSNYQKQKQLAWVNEKLTNHERDLLGMLGFQGETK